MGFLAGLILSVRGGITMDRFKAACDELLIQFTMDDFEDYESHCWDQAIHGYAAPTAEEWLLDKYGIPF